MTIDQKELNFFHTQMHVSHEMFLSINDEYELKKHVKEELIRKMLYEIVKQNYIEFTVQNEPLNDVKIYRARMVAVSNNTIAKMRKSGVFNNKEI